MKLSTYLVSSRQLLRKSVEVTDLIDEYENISREHLEELGVQGIISTAEERASSVDQQPFQ